mmetsp:Transcript_9996/g.31316  ORF Transcript_9996/g.31316 Transcript_9996/m.31316 type:complete len:341 (+) Transcript_9996:33-1055(+)
MSHNKAHGRTRERSAPSARAYALAERLVRVLLGHVCDPRAVEDAHDGNGVVVLQIRQQLGREHEALRRARLRRRAAQELVDLALVVGVHALVDLVHNAEGRASERLQAEQVQHGAHAALTAALPLARKPHQLLVVAELDVDGDLIVLVVLARLLKLHLATAADEAEIVHVLLRDLRHQVAQCRQPRTLDLVHLSLGLVVRCLAVPCLALEHLDLGAASLVLGQRVRVGQHHRVRAPLVLRDLALALLRRVRQRRELFAQLVAQLAHLHRLSLLFLEPLLLCLLLAAEGGKQLLGLVLVLLRASRRVLCRLHVALELECIKRRGIARRNLARLLTHQLGQS